MKKIILPILSLLIFLPNVDARFWTNKDGKTFEGELVEVKDNAVTIRRKSDRRKFTLNVADLSQGDQEYLTKIEEDKKAEEEAKKEKPKSSKTALPKTKEELAVWLVGTEWITTGTQRWVRRFYKDGLMKTQGQHKWFDDAHSRTPKYRVMDKRTVYITSGGGEFTITFDASFKSFKSKNASKKDLEIEGKLKGRFELPRKSDEGLTVKGKRIVDDGKSDKTNSVSSEDSLPKTKEEFAKWIVGTEWAMSQVGKNTRRSLRFHPNGLLLFQFKTSEWDKNLIVNESDYTVLSENSIVWGSVGWTIVFDHKSMTFKGKISDGTKSITGKLTERFILL